MEINRGERRAIPPWGDLFLLVEGLCSSSLSKKVISQITCSQWEGDILALLKKGHFNFAQSGDILTLP